MQVILTPAFGATNQSSAQNPSTSGFNKQYFTEAMEAMSYDSIEQPLGKLSERILKSGYELLKELAALIGNPCLIRRRRQAQSKVSGLVCKKYEEPLKPT